MIFLQHFQFGILGFPFQGDQEHPQHLPGFYLEVCVDEPRWIIKKHFNLS